MHRAEYWEKKDQGVQCQLCPQQCRIFEGQQGLCGVRGVHSGTLQALAYARIAAAATDPIEKKPLYHVKPGRTVFSIGSAGCNLKCIFCQNWTLSQSAPDLRPTTPGQVVDLARAEGACGVAYTYNEPLINIEFLKACARLAKDSGLLNVVVTNGYINPRPLDDLLPLVDAWNIDLKSMDDRFYVDQCQGRMAPVLETIRRASARSHVELTHLVVTGANDDLGKIETLTDWIAALSPAIPLHLTRYYPNYRAAQPPTDPAFLLAAQQAARRKLDWVYVGNLQTGDDSTHCPACGTLLIVRHGYSADRIAVRDGKCPTCGKAVPGLF